ncbi:MAG TPA: SgcJ/EcaC family oxidoreductase [Candidatus Binatia bacterium]|nr:SgcJ/EcaC family oxidoreductase [Candidatus Binatia bacterium]
MTEDEQKIRGVIATWIRATAEGELDRVLDLMADDVVFLIAGQPPMRGKDAFAAASQTAAGRFHIDGRAEIQEITIAGNYAYCWNQLSVTVTPMQGGSASKRAGHTLSVFRKEPDGRWVLFRDANLLAPV